MSKKLTSTIAGAFIFITLVNILSRGLGFFREMLFANYFGRGVEFDVYLIGAVIPITVNTVILYIGQNYFIPAYHKIKADQPGLTSKFFSINFFFSIIAGCAIAILLYIFSDLIISGYIQTDNESIKKIALGVFRLFLTTIPLNFAISIITAFQQAEYKFKYPAVGRLFLNIAVIPALILFNDRFGIYTIPAGFILGTTLQLVYLLNKGMHGFSIKSIFPFDRKVMFDLIDFTIINIILIEIIGQIYLLSDRYFFDSVNPGGLSSLNYAFNLFNLPISIVSVALATVIFPKFSEYIHSKSFAQLHSSVSDSMSFNLLIFVPVTFLFFLYGDSIIKFLFERGKFSGTDTIDTFFALKAYSVSLIFYSSYTVLNKLLYSAKLVNTLLLITVLGIVIKVILNYIFVGLWQQNGLALSTSISFIFFFFATLTVVYKKIPLGKKNIFISEFIFHLSNGLISFIIVKQISLFSNVTGIYTNIVEVILFLIIYLVNVLITGNRSFLLIIKSLKNMNLLKSA